MPSSEDRTMRVMLWKGKMRQTNESRPGKQGGAYSWVHQLILECLLLPLSAHPASYRENQRPDRVTSLPKIPQPSERLEGH
jgi:hypothetical protein